MYALLTFIVGLLALAAVALPLLLRDRLISFPIVIVAAGMLIPSLFPAGTFDPIRQGFAAEHLSEFAVIVALTGLGLSIDRRISWRGWMTTWRLLAFTMPLSIAAAMFIGWWVVGLAPAAALLFGASLAPTDPVLAVDVQTGPPTTGNPDADEHDEVRFGLTSESSLNDGLAFPFTNLAVLVGIYGFTPAEWLTSWLLIDVGYKIIGGILVGWLVGRTLGALTLRLVGGRGFVGLFDEGKGLAPSVMVLAYTLISYGLCEVVHAYGFIAVFVTAYVVRDTERQNHVHDHLHEGAEQLELLAMSVVLLLIGAAFSDSLWPAVTWQMVLAAASMILVVRPLTAWLGLWGHRGASREERAMISFFGIRGLGSIYYLAYGINRVELVDTTALWAFTAVTIFVSLLIHGLTARPAMRWLEAHRLRQPTAGESVEKG
ncbi:MAG: cation:proton antiporter [Nitriliruptoraceae bacterium]